MPQVGDEIRIVSCGEIFGEQACNVLYYTVGLWTGNLTIQEVLGELLAGQHGATAAARSSQHELLYMLWNNLTNPVEQDRRDTLVPAPGSRVEDGLPPSSAYSVVLNRFNNSTRQGYKRLAGCVESQQTDGAHTLTQPVIDSITGFFGSTFVTSVGDELDPVIIGRNPDGSLNLAVVNPIVSASLQPNITTQNTRKFGRGS